MDGKPIHDLSLGVRRSSKSLVSPCPAGPERKVGEQLCDALGRVVMHPMRRTEQALDAVQVGHVVVVGLGWVGAELLSAVRRVD